jgi:hypothetical protein
LRYLSLNLEIDHEAKTWKLRSKRMFAPQWQRRTYEDIEKIFKSRPEIFKVSEERDADGKFRRFTVETTRSEPDP